MESSIIDGDLEDGDLCLEEDLKQQFASRYSVFHQSDLIPERYILHISGISENNFNFIIASDDHSAGIYNVSNNQVALNQTVYTTDNIIGVAPCLTNENLYYIGTDREIIVRDARLSEDVTSYKDSTTKTKNKNDLLCFDISSNNRLLCGGTEGKSDAYILFWDVRQNRHMGAYWNSHMKDITQIHFHPDDMNKLISGSTDGLINVYDVSKSKETEALIESLNTESPVEKLEWFGGNYDSISCVTCTNDLQLWKLDTAAPYAKFDRNYVTSVMQRKSEEFTYVADTYVKRNGRLSVLAGSRFEESPCLRGFNLSEKTLVPTHNFKENKQIVRCSWYNHVTNTLITSGENGTFDIWKLEDEIPS